MRSLEKLAELAKELPAPLKDNAEALVVRMGQTIEGFGDKPIEWKPETLKVVQGTSDRSKLPKGAAVGAIVVGEDIIQAPFEVIPLRLFTTRQMWDSDPNVAQMICSSPDALVGYRFGDCRVCPNAKYDDEAKKSSCNKTITVLNISADLSRIFYINFSKTAYANGLAWQSSMRKTGFAPYRKKYALSTQTSPKSKNVELLSAEPIVDGKINTGPILSFLEELFEISGEDRKIALSKFYELVELRKKNTEAITGPDNHTLTLLPSPDEIEVEEVSEEPTEAPVEKKKYNV